MRILVLNSGSSTVRFRLLDMSGLPTVVASGMAEEVSDHRKALDSILEALPAGKLGGIGHRVVHGGERFQEPVRVTPAVLETLRTLIPLAPLHNPAGILGMEKAQEMWPSVPQVAVFDTAFHRTLPPKAFRYAIPEGLFREHGIRRYGFHGISHSFVARRAAAYLTRPPASLNLITVHLGNGASAAAIRSGNCIDTSMGLTPLEGLVMGTRSGDIDPAVFAYLARVAGKSPDDVEAILTRESGLQGLGGSNDMREIERRAGQHDERAQLAVEVFAYRVKKYLGAYAAALGRLDAVVFTGGIGENSALVREKSLEDLSILGIRLDERKNSQPSGVERAVHAKGSLPVLIIPTDEELEIATQTIGCIKATKQ